MTVTAHHLIHWDSVQKHKAANIQTARSLDYQVASSLYAFPSRCPEIPISVLFLTVLRQFVQSLYYPYPTIVEARFGGTVP